MLEIIDTHQAARDHFGLNMCGELSQWRVTCTPVAAMIKKQERNGSCDHEVPTGMGETQYEAV
jgi:hypothetical protein